MKEKNYIVRLTAKGPVHIGSGEIARKKEYVYNQKENRIDFLDMRKFTFLLMQEGLIESYHHFIQRDNHKKGLYEFLVDHDLQKKYRSTIRYSLDSSALSFRKGKPLNDIALAIKDPYANPYIPGSSLKGALIENLLYACALKNRDRLERKYRNRFAAAREKYKRWRAYKEIGESLSEDLSRLLIGEHYKELGKYISVGDSVSVKKDNLILAQKSDLIISPKGEAYDKQNNLNLIRESIDRETELSFPLKLTDPHKVSASKLLDAIEDTFIELDGLYRDLAGFDEMQARHIYVGGGTGYISKTLVYSLFERDEAVDVAIDVLRANFKKHKREEDRAVKLAPRTVKMAKTVHGIEEMGLCKIDIEEVSK